MLYVLIMYCAGTCPANFMPPPSSGLLFTSMADCKAQLHQHDDWHSSVTIDGKEMKNTSYRETCARVLADPKQLDRLITPQGQVAMLNDYKAELKAHPQCVLGSDDDHCLKHDPPMATDKCKGETLCNGTATFSAFAGCRVGEYAVWGGYWLNQLMCEDPKSHKLRSECAFSPELGEWPSVYYVGWYDRPGSGAPTREDLSILYPRYWIDDLQRRHCKHGIILYGTKCIVCEREAQFAG